MKLSHGTLLATFISLIVLLGMPTASAEMGGDGKIDKTDSCYFVVTDRFFNGDPTNDDQGFG